MLKHSARAIGLLALPGCHTLFRKAATSIHGIVVSAIATARGVAELQLVTLLVHLIGICRYYQLSILAIHQDDETRLFADIFFVKVTMYDVARRRNSCLKWA